MAKVNLFLAQGHTHNFQVLASIDLIILTLVKPINNNAYKDCTIHTSADLCSLIGQRRAQMGGVRNEK